MCARHSREGALIGPVLWEGKEAGWSNGVMEWWNDGVGTRWEVRGRSRFAFRSFHLAVFY